MSKLSNTTGHENYIYLPPYLFLFIWGFLFILIIALAKPDSSGRACGRWWRWAACSSGARAPRHCKMLIWTRRRRERICHFIGSLVGDEKRAKPSRAQLLPQARPTSPFSCVDTAAGGGKLQVQPPPLPPWQLMMGSLARDTAKIVAAKG